MSDFKNLKIWQDSIKLIKYVYELIDSFPENEKYGLSSQLARSINSVGANIAESSGRFHYKDRLNFLYNARGSLLESEHHLNVALELGYIGEGDLKKAERMMTDLQVRLNNYVKTIRKRVG